MTARPGGNIRVIPTFNAPTFVTVWMPAQPTLGTHPVSDQSGNTYYLDLEQPDGTQCYSIAGEGLVSITSFTPATPTTRGHVEGTFGGFVTDGIDITFDIADGRFACDFDYHA